MARPVNVHRAAAGAQLLPHGRSFGPLGRDGRPAGRSLPARPATAAKPVLGATATRTGPNTDLRTVRPLTAPTTVDANFNGITQAGSNCGGCQPPDPNAAVSPTQIAHVVNLRLQVFNKTGGTLCGVGLNTFIGTSASISDPHIQWDNLNNRFSLVVIPVPASTAATPTLFLLTSQTADGCGTWWVYTVTFSGSLYPAGTLLDYPYLGQDRVALLSSSNNFRRTSTGGFTYINSAVFAIPKSAAYAGAGFSFSSFAVGFSTAPVTVTGIPIAATTDTYYLRSIPGTGYQLYRMNNSAGPGTTLTPLAVASSAFSAPPRRVNQPGTATTLDPLDGRIQAPPFQDEGFVWFTHAQAIGSFPGVRYGAISVSSNTVTAQNAFRSGTSDDFNPSIGVADAGANVVYLWLNWAYTDTPAGVPTSNTVDGVTPGGGVPALIGTGLVLATGSSTSSNTRFGDLSSVAIDPTAASPTCPAGRTAVTAQEIFQSNGQWITRIGRLSFC
ncbi:MAG: hypothetical protein ACJ73E_07515 [Mycobacteriales bacterium]